MEPDKSSLKLLPKPLVNTAARVATVNATLAGILTIVGFLVLWAPLYLLRADGQLVLAPFVFVCIPVIWYFAVRAIVFGRRGLRWAAAPAGAPARRDGASSGESPPWYSRCRCSCSAACRSPADLARGRCGVDQ
jgi:hypothetical protein